MSPHDPLCVELGDYEIVFVERRGWFISTARQPRRVLKANGRWGEMYVPFRYFPTREAAEEYLALLILKQEEPR